MGKSELFSHFADRFEVKRTQAREFFDELTTLAEKELKRSGEFVLPGMVKLVVQKRKARMGRNPATGEAIKIPAKTVVKARIAKQLKDSVLPQKVKGRATHRPLAAPVGRARQRADLFCTALRLRAAQPFEDGGTGGEATAVDGRRHQPGDLRFEARQRVVVHDDAIGGLEQDLAAVAAAAARGPDARSSAPRTCGRRFRSPPSSRAFETSNPPHLHGRMTRRTYGALSEINAAARRVLQALSLPGRARCRSAFVRRNSRTKVVPLPTSLATEIRPPSCSTIFFEMARPSPRPRRLVVTKSSKTLPSRSGAMPHPVS